MFLSQDHSRGDRDCWLLHTLHLCENTTAHALLDEEIHVAVCKEFEFDAGVFEKRVPTQSGTCVVVGWVQAAVFEVCFSEVSNTSARSSVSVAR